MSGELKRELIDRPIVHDMPLFVRKVIPDVVDQRCAYISVVAPICGLTSRCAVACKTTTHAT